eukprot:scaffold1186_cov117-Skeletonema_dohrnii-CCMP3373.AAC.6
MNKKERASSAVTLRITSTSSQKPFATADNTADEESAAVNSNKRNTQTKFDRKRQASTDEKLPTKKADVNKYNNNRKKCSAYGCTNENVVQQKGGVCTKHGAKVKRRCSREGCTNVAVQGGVCVRHGAKVKLCSSEGCTKIKPSVEECARGMGQGSSDAAVKDAQMEPSMEEFAGRMGQRRNENYAAVKDAQIKLKMEECA